MGYIRKALEKGFSEMYRLGGGWSGTIFFRKLTVPIESLGFFACSGQVSDRLHRSPTPITLGKGVEVYEGKIMKLLLMGSYLEWQKIAILH